MTDLISLDEFRAAAREHRSTSGGVLRLATGPAAEVNGAARTLRFCFSDGSVDRAGDKIDPHGWDLDGFLPNPVALWAHDSFSPPIGRASNVGPVGGRLMGNIEFAPAETYAFADTIYRLAKDGYVNAVSVGFRPLEWSFTNEKDRPYGIDFTRQELLEISLCPVPCNANALVEARAKGIDTRPLNEWAERVLESDGGKVVLSRGTLEEIFKATHTPNVARTRYRSLTETKMADWKCGASRDLPVEDSESWDGAAAEKSIFEWAGGDDFDPAKARKGFLFYDASKPKERGSYKDPIAHVVDGGLKVPKGAIKAAASRLPQTDVPDSVKKEGEAVLAHYKEKAGMKAAGEGTNAGGGALVGSCGRSKDEECGMKDASECSIHAPEIKSRRSSSLHVVASCGRAKDEECGLKDESECAIHGAGSGAPKGDCGRAKDEACGMKDESECATHAPVKRFKSAGRRLSAKHRAKLEEATYHHEAAITHHKAAMRAIKDVMADDDADNDVEPDADDGKPTLHVVEDSTAAALKEILG